jgi:hypothetical protein
MTSATLTGPNAQEATLAGAQVRRFMRKLAASAVCDAQQSHAQETVARCIDVFEGSSWPAVAWRFSDLNLDGCPLEVCFSSSRRALRYTVEAAGPEFANEARLGLACALASSVGAAPMQGDVAAWKSMQAAGPLGWGAALGVRHDADGERLKIYLEVPDSISSKGPLTRLDTARRPECGLPLFHRDSRLVMFGHDLKSGTREFYFRLPMLDHIEARAVRSALESNQDTAPLIPVFASLFPMPIETALQWFNLGYSVAISPVGAPRVSLFFRSAAVDNARLQALLRGSAFPAPSSSLYAEFLPVIVTEIPHGMVTLISHSGAIETRVGISALALARQPEGAVR